MRESYDVVIVGGAVIGSSVAWALMEEPGFDGSVLVVERDMGFRQASTALSAASIRTQFSNPVNVKTSQYGLDIIHKFPDVAAVDGRPGPDLGFVEGGYLTLAATEPQAEILRENHSVQAACGADVLLMEPADLAEAFPHLNVDDLKLGAWGRSGEGWFDNVGLMTGFRNRARALGAEVHPGEVVSVREESGRVAAVTLSTGERIACGWLINAAGPRAAGIAAMAGLSIPVEPRKRTVFVFDCQTSPQGTARVKDGCLPLMVDPTGVYVRPEGRFFLSGASPVDDTPVDPDDFEPRHEEFEEIIWPALAARSPAFEAIKPVNMWAGHYAFNTLDHNMILGPHPDLPNFLFANGFSGHGLQQAPAVGRGVAEWIAYGGYRALDLSAFGYERIINNTPFLEREVI